jgi:phosphonate transport system substrate-binding protein
LASALRWFLHRLVLGALLCAGLGAHAAGTSATGGATPAGELKPELLNVAFSPSAFLNVNRNDVEAGYVILTQTVGRRRGYLVTTRAQIFESPSEFDSMLRDSGTRMMVLDSSRFLALEDRAIKPHFVTAERGQVGKQYLLLTKRDSGLNTLADLKQKEILVYEVANTTQGRFWLETLLLEHGHGTPTGYFARIDGVGKPSSAVLPVFFGRKQACIVDRAGFDLMTELNPQVGKSIQVVASSERLLDSLICLRESDWGPGRFREDLIQTLAELHREPAGAQVLTLFKTDQLVPFDEKQLATMRALQATHQRLSKEARP